MNEGTPEGRCPLLSPFPSPASPGPVLLGFTLPLPFGVNSLFWHLQDKC